MASKAPMMVSAAARSRPEVDGKFFRLGGSKFHPKGVTYGPFPPNGQGEHFCHPKQTARDFVQIRELGANLAHIYFVPPRWFLDLAAQHELRLLVDVPWERRACFLDHASKSEAAVRAVRQAALACAGHPALFALSVANEIPADIVRWSGQTAVEDFVDGLVGIAKEVDPDCLCTFGNFPTTEYLRPREIDFLCFNVYLEQVLAFSNYLSRLQMLADTKPLVLGEFGLDSLRHGEERQAALLAGQVEAAFRAGLAGAVVYSFTDEWFKDGRLIQDWRFGLTTEDRQPKAAFAAVQQVFRVAPHHPLVRQPRVSVVVACYNGARTLKTCLESLERLRYPDYEVVLVDDGSTDATPQIAAQFKKVRCLRHPRNLGLSTARNTGIAAAQGDIVAFTDADCRPDEDWLYYLVNDLQSDHFVGVGGHNLLPPEDSSVAAAVLVSPGGPAHVMLNDRSAEHLPGCNMAVWKWALLECGCFDPVFRRAGDDVDLCWRLQQRGGQLGFSPAGFVWHYRRSTVGDYLKQQQGYGEAEALLERKHPENFNRLGGSVWRGRIYTPTPVGPITSPPMVYHGLFGNGFFQSLYTAPPSLALMLPTSLEYHVLVTLPLLVLAAMFRWLIPVALASLALSLGICVAAAAQADLPARKRQCWSRPLVALLFALQPMVRGWARYRSRLFLRQTPLAAYETLDSLSRKQQGQVHAEVAYLLRPGVTRREFLARTMEGLDRQSWQYRTDTGWNEFDLEVYGSRWSKLQVTTVTELSDDGDQVIRCRLRPAATLPSRVAFWSLLGLCVLIIGLTSRETHWPWLLLLMLPAFGWWLNREQSDLQRLIGVFLDDTAETLVLAKRAAPPTPASARPQPMESGLKRRLRTWFGPGVGEPN